MTEPFLHDPVVITPEQALSELPSDADQMGHGQGPETLVVALAQPLCDLLVETLGARATTKVGPAQLFRAPNYAGAGIVHPGMGAPGAALVVERCIAAGTKRILSIGFGAAIVPNARSGEVCLVDGVQPRDGLTSHYAAPGYRPEPDAGLTRTLAEALEAHRLGTIVTTDAPYRQATPEIEQHREDGVLAVDMETGAVLTVAAYRGVPAASLLVASDEIDGTAWVSAEAGAIDEGVGVAVRALVGLLKGLRNLPGA